MNLMNRVKEGIRTWLDIQEAQGGSIVIREAFGYEADVLRNRLWYRGDPAELHQFFGQVDDKIGNASFWCSASTMGVDFRKIHTGIPSLVTDVLASIVARDFNGIEINNTEADKIWESIEKENSFRKILEKTVLNLLVDGDGAFKINYDPDISEYPLIEFYSGIDVDFTRRRGRVTEITFLHRRKYNKQEFIGREIYSENGVCYEVYDSRGKKRELSEFENTDVFSDFTFVEASGKGFMMAVPVFFGSSSKWDGRGRSLFDTKTGAFDSLDECWSQWVDALRDGRTKTYIPENMVPRHPKTGNLLRPNTFDGRFLATSQDMSQNAKNQIETVSGEIRHDSLLATYMTSLDLCLQGIISPSTLGVDVKKLDNAEAQREKEKVTLYTRNKIIEAITEPIEALAIAVLQTYDTIRGRSPVEYEATATFGEYANPSFEAVVETVGKAKMQGIMSNELVVEELYGDTLTDDEKAAEVERLNMRDGLSAKEEPGVSLDVEM